MSTAPIWTGSSRSPDHQGVVAPLVQRKHSQWALSTCWESMKDLDTRAAEIIEEVVYITVATASDDGDPWNSPVFSAYDRNYTFYWGSHTDSQHSRNIRSNGRAFLVIYDSTVPAGTGEGVYIRASAAEVTEPSEVAAAHRLLRDRRPVPFWKPDDIGGDAPIRLFKAVPDRVWMNDDGEVNGTYIDKRTAVTLGAGIHDR